MQSYNDVLNFVEEENIRFIKLVYFDVMGEQKNISIMPGELKRAFDTGISFDASAVRGFADPSKSDYFLRPDPTTLTLVPWRSLDGGVCRMFCDIYSADGTLCEHDTRQMLKEAVKEARKMGLSLSIGPEMEFYVFKQNEDGENTYVPIDKATYMSVAPADKGENLRRSICFTLLEMGITPEASHHEQGPGQNEIDIHYSDPLTAADNTSTVKWAVSNLADTMGYCADFSPKPLRSAPGNGMHLNISVMSDSDQDYTDMFMAGIMKYIRDITLFLNPCENSYERFGHMEAPYYVSWSEQNRSQLIRIPADPSGKKRFELRSPDPKANPYLMYYLLIHAGLEGIRQHLVLNRPMNVNLFKADPDLTRDLEKLPRRLEEAMECARRSEFVAKYVPATCLDAYCAD